MNHAAVFFIIVWIVWLAPLQGSYAAFAQSDPAPSVKSDEPKLAIQRGHTGFVFAVAVTPDGKYAVSGSWDSTVKVWDLSGGRELLTLYGHENPVTAIAVSRSGKVIASGGRDGGVNIWELPSGSRLESFPLQGSQVTSLSVSRDDGRVACGFADGSVLVWKLGGADPRPALLSGHTARVTSVCVTPDCKNVLTASSDKTIRLWELESGKELKTVATYEDAVTAMALSSDGAAIFAGLAGGEIKIIDYASSELRQTIQAHEGIVFSIAVSDGSKYLATSTEGSDVKIWDIASGNLVTSIEGYKKFVSSVALSPDAGKLVLGGSSNDIKVFDPATGRQIRTLQGRTSAATALAIVSKKRIVAGYADSSVKTWDLSSANVLKTFAPHKGAITSVVAPDKDDVIVSSSVDKTVKIWNAKDFSVARTIDCEGLGGVTSAAVSPDSKLIAIATSDMSVKIWEAESGKEIGIVSGLSGPAQSLDISGDGKLLAIACGDGAVKLFELPACKELRVLSGHTSPVNSVTFSGDNKLILTGSSDKTVRVWDASTGETIKTLSGHGASVSVTIFNGDGTLAFSGGQDGTIKMWNVSEGTEIRSFKGHTGTVTGLALSPNGKAIVSSSIDGTIMFWDTQTGSRVGTQIGFKDGEWVFLTPDNRFDCSLYGSDYCGWVSGLSYYSFELYEDKYRSRGLPLRTLAPYFDLTAPPAEDVKTVEGTVSLPPTVVITSPEDNIVTREQAIDIRVTVVHSKDVAGVNLYHNGKEFKGRGIAGKRKGTSGGDSKIAGGDPRTPGGDSKTTAGQRQLMQFEYTIQVTLAAGENTIGIQAVDADGVRSVKETIRVTYNPAQIIRPRLWILAVGISRYNDTKLALQYGASDAEKFVKAVQGAGGLYEAVNVELVTDENATKTGILKGISKVARQASVQDVVIIFIAGHGAKDTRGNYYYIACDTDKDDLFATAVSWRDIEGGIEQMAAQKVVLFADTCHSGDVLRGRDIIDDTQSLVEKLVKACGVALLVSSTGQEKSLESQEWGGGAFTKAIIEAIENFEGRADSDKDGAVSIIEMQQYVTRRVIELTKGMQHPYVPPSPKGYTDFPIVMSKP